MKKVLSIVMTLAILLGCFGYSAYATNGKVAKTVPSKSQSITVKAPQESKSNNSDVAQTVDPVERRRQILAKRESDIKANEERAAYISQKIAENGGKFWVDEHGNTHFMNTNRISDDSQLTEEQLASNTSDLLNLVLESKKLFSAIITSGDSTLSGVYDRAVESFNGLQELERREDATEVILQKYIDEYTFVKDNNVDYYSSHLCELKLMLKQEIFALFLTPDGKSTVEAINAGTYEATPYSTITNESTRSITGIGDDIVYTVAGNVATSGGGNAQVLTASRDFTASEKTQINNIYDTIGGTRIYTACSKYNCHSFAWHLASSSNPYWTNAVGVYMNDSHAYPRSANAVQKYDTVVYKTSYGVPVHSGIVTNVAANGTITVKSKWGQAGAYSHQIDVVPDSYYSNSSTHEVNVSFYNYHFYNKYVDYNAFTHRIKCKVCGKYNGYENHVLNNAGTACAKCGHPAPFGETIPMIQ